MALVLGIKKGRHFIAGDLKVRVVDILSPESFKVCISGKNVRVAEFLINGTFTKLTDNVSLRSGLDGTPTTARCVIEAPKDIKIHQEAPWRVTPFALKQWAKEVPGQSVNKLLEIARLATKTEHRLSFPNSKTGNQERLFNYGYGALIFRIDNKRIIEIRVKVGNTVICGHCINTGYVMQWDDIDNRGVRVPCNCKRRK